MSTPDRDAVIDALGGLIAGLHVPRSMGSVMVPTEYDIVRRLINDFGWSSSDEIAAKLRVALFGATGEGVTWHRCGCSENCGQRQPGPGLAAIAADYAEKVAASEKRVEAIIAKAKPRYCGCRVDAELNAGSVCPSCGHRDHGASGCRAVLET